MIVRTNIENHIAKIELNSPANNNALSPTMIEAITKAFDDAEYNEGIHVILLYTKHGNFCSGADLPHMISMFKKTYEENLLDATQFAGLFLRIYNCKKPVVCFVCGNITAGALGLMSTCDINIATHDAKFSFPEVQLSGVPYTISPFVIKRIGDAHATKLMLTAEIFDAEEARRVGLINYVAEDSFKKGLSVATDLQKNNLQSMMETKKWLRTISPLDKTILEKSAESLARMRMKPETRDAIVNFMKPRF